MFEGNCRFYRLDQDALTDDSNWIIGLLRSASVFNFIVEMSILQDVGTGHMIYAEVILTSALMMCFISKVFPIFSFTQ